jgi:hypothetical protein
LIILEVELDLSLINFQIIKKLVEKDSTSLLNSNKLEILIDDVIFTTIDLNDYNKLEDEFFNIKFKLFEICCKELEIDKKTIIEVRSSIIDYKLDVIITFEISQQI